MKTYKSIFREVMLMKRGKILVSGIILMIFLMAGVLAQSNLDLERQQRLKYGKVIYIQDLNVTPVYISPGYEAKLELTISNVGDFQLKDVIVKLDLPEQFSPDIGDTIRRKLRIMKPNSSEKFIFNIKTLPSAGEGVYSFSLIISYLNQIGEEIEETSTISLFIGSNPEIVVLFSNSEIYNGNNKGKITLDVVNKGLTDIKFLTAELMDSEDYDILSSDKVYIGDVDSDDFESADFNLKLLKDTQEIQLPLKIEYRDANNRQYTEQIDVLIEIPEKSDVKKISSWIIWVIVIAVLIGAYMIYKKFKKQKIYNKE